MGYLGDAEKGDVKTMEQDSVLAAIDILVNEASDRYDQPPDENFLKLNLTPAQMQSICVKEYRRQTETTNAGAKEMSIEVSMENLRFSSLTAQKDKNKYCYTLFSLSCKGPVLLYSGERYRGFLQGISFHFGQRHAFVSGLGLLGAELSLICPGVKLDDLSTDGELILADEKNGLRLYDSACRIDFHIISPIPISDEVPRSVKGLFTVGASTVCASAGSHVYPFDKYVFKGSLQFPHSHVLLKPEIRSNLESAEGLTLQTGIAKSIYLSANQAWNMALFFVREQKRLQFVYGALALLAAVPAGFFLPSPVWRSICYGIGVVTFMLLTVPRVPGISWMYPTRVLAIELAAIIVGGMEYCRYLRII